MFLLGLMSTLLGDCIVGEIEVSNVLRPVEHDFGAQCLDSLMELVKAMSTACTLP